MRPAVVGGAALLNGAANAAAARTKPAMPAPFAQPAPSGGAAGSGKPGVAGPSAAGLTRKPSVLGPAAVAQAKGAAGTSAVGNRHESPAVCKKVCAKCTHTQTHTRPILASAMSSGACRVSRVVFLHCCRARVCTCVSVCVMQGVSDAIPFTVLGATPLEDDEAHPHGNSGGGDAPASHAGTPFGKPKPMRYV